MPEEEPKQPEFEPLFAKPQGANPGGIPTPQELEATSKKATKRPQPFLKALGIKTLRGTIQLLEGIVETLETEPVEPRRDVAGNVLAPTGEAPPVVVIPQIPASATETPITRITTAAPDQPSVTITTPISQKRWRFHWWTAALQKIRSLLPESVNQKLPDWSLTTAIIALVILLIWTPFALLSAKPEPTSVAEIPPAKIETPPELIAPQSPEPVKIEPPPGPVLTPEENLIAGIQKQVAQLTSQYAADGLIQSIQANFEGSLLTVKVSDGWYDLSQSQQDKLANEMFSQSQKLDFSKLEIRDSQDTVLARSPVVGGNMVILKRRVIAANS